MKKYKDNTSPSAEEMQRYLRNEMPERERYAFEKKLLASSFYSDAEEGLSAYPPDSTSKDIKKLRKQLLAKKSNKNRGWFTPLKIAAGIAVAFVVSWILIELIDVPGRIAPDNISQKADQVADITPGDSASSLSENMLSYENNEQDKKPGDSSSPPVKEETIISPKSKPLNENETEAATNKEEQPVADEIDNLTTLDMDDTEVDAASTLKNKIEEISRAEQDRSVAAAAEKKSPRAANKGVDITENSAGVVPLVQNAPAGEKMIAGRVISGQDMAPLPGVNIFIKGTSKGTVTDIEGRFHLSIPDSTDQTLVVSFIGFQSLEVEVEESDELEIALDADMTQLSEVVVVGYGTNQKEEPVSIRRAQPEGGFLRFRRYLKENMKYPTGYDEKVVVKVEFTVTAEGDITDIRFNGEMEEPFKNEVRRLLKNGPSWQPSTADGLPREESVKIKIRFRPPK